MAAPRGVDTRPLRRRDAERRRRRLGDHIVEKPRSRGWNSLTNGELLDAAEAAGFDVFMTTDGKIQLQQKLTGFRGLPV